jgi:hypothetical protein
MSKEMSLTSPHALSAHWLPRCPAASQLPTAATGSGTISQLMRLREDAASTQLKFTHPPYNPPHPTRANRDSGFFYSRVLTAFHCPTSN